ncbi:MAG TPA: GlsB/YeaQ/YmgE family stress response membrane protein [Caldilineae bacterium]|nr:GlsB/YeaQ/YmgE family stress response membrane protein [Caldilineae bacterium]
MSSLVILFIIWIIMGAGLGYYATSIFKGDRPYGVNGDLIAGILTAIVVGLMDWFIVPMVFPNFGQGMIFLASILEPLLSILIVLWLMRYIKNR